MHDAGRQQQKQKPDIVLSAILYSPVLCHSLHSGTLSHRRHLWLCLSRLVLFPAHRNLQHAYKQKTREEQMIWQSEVRCLAFFAK